VAFTVVNKASLYSNSTWGWSLWCGSVPVQD